MKTTYDRRHLLRNKKNRYHRRPLIFMSVNFRHGGYVHFRGIRANLNFEKNKVFETKKIKRANVTKSYPIASS